jgi:hypothetical protein
VDRALGPALALLAACFSPEPPAGAPCGAQLRCPSPLVCVSRICQHPGSTGGGPADAPGGPDATLQCPDAFQKMPSGACHLEVAAFPLPWLQAERDCEQRGGHLVVPDSAAEAAEVPEPRWIGISDRTLEDQFRAVTGAIISFTSWDTGEPEGDFADCAHTSGGGRWSTGPCDFPFPYVCEYDGLPASSGAF